MTDKDRLELILDAMTPIQRRRYEPYLKGRTLTEIAKKEGVSVVAVWFSIYYGKKTAKKRVGHLKNT